MFGLNKHNLSLSMLTPLENSFCKTRYSLTGFTLLELITVVIIAAILVSLAVPFYIKTVERAYDKEAITNLKLIKAAEGIYRMRYAEYYTSNVLDDIITSLSLDLIEVAWGGYLIDSVDPETSFDASVNRLTPPSGYNRTWNITESLDEPSCTGNGCP